MQTGFYLPLHPAPAPASSASVARLQDINAHEKPVNCLCIGRKTGNIIASGGDDKKVNIWSLGRPQALRSLSDKSLTAPVQSVQVGVLFGPVPPVVYAP